MWTVRLSRPGRFAVILGALGLIIVLITPITHASSTSAASSGQKKGTCVSPDAPYEDYVEQFDYNTKAPLDVKEVGVTTQDGVSIHDITYVSQKQTVSAYLVVPAGSGPFAGILFQHWLDSSPTANRTEFLNEAVTLAKKGVVSLLPQGFYPWIDTPQSIQHDCAATISQTIALRRGLDLLLSRSQVDHKRIAFVGHDYGAMYGAILSGVEKRVKTYVLMAPTARFSNWNVPFFLDTLNARQRLEYTIKTASLDPMAYIEHAAPATVHFQFARQDRFVSLADVNNLVEVASNPSTVNLYDADHSLTDGKSQQDRDTWLTNDLGLQ